MRRPLHRGFHLRPGKVTDADHADVAVRPRLPGCPLDQVVHVETFLAIKKAKGSSGATGASTVCDDVYIAARNEEIACTRFDKACRCAKVLNLSRIWGGGDQYGISAGSRGTMYVRQQCNSIAHWHCNIVIVCHRVAGLRQVTILAARGLWTIESALTGLDAGRLVDSHGDAPVFGQPIRYQSTCHPDSR